MINKFKILYVKNAVEKIPTERSNTMKEIQYFYMKAQTVKQQLSFIDFMRCYEMVVNVTDAIQANHLWHILRVKINGRIFKSFTEFNATILDSIRDHIGTYIAHNNTQQKRQLDDYTVEQQQQQQQQQPAKKKQRLVMPDIENLYITRPAKRPRFCTT